ncbi:MAG: DedA family protein [Deltaproteobacteria bacterium]|nr:MAG: DedA family protein [Deltaproteobacteria bacterium]TMB38374.1 MAG: DedA family protein [Deltaproteobacteria bacterium]
MYAALAIFGAVLSTLIVPLPEELALLGAGWWAHAGALPLWGAWLAAWLAIVAGDTASYMIGRSFLPRLLRTRFGRRIVAPDLRKWGEDLVRRHGFRAILLGRFLVALRGPVYLAIGGSKYPMLRFELINGCVGLIEVAALVGLGYEFGRSAKLAHEVRFLEIAVAAIMAAILIVPPIVKWRLVRRHRRAANA